VNSKSSSFAVVLALVYGAFGIIWIGVSDTLLASAVSDPIALTMAQTWKGWAFVGFSAALIYGVGRRLLRAIEASERRYRMLFADSPEALALYDPQTLRLVEINAAAGRLFGYEPAEARGLSFTDLMPRETRTRLEAEMPRLLDGQRAGGIWQMRRKDGRAVDVATHGQRVVIGDRMLRLVQINDVTARLRAEHELLRSMEEVEASNERMRELAHALSHDLREPLRQVTGFVQLLAKRYGGRLDEEAHQFIEYAVEGTLRLKTLIDDAERYAVPAPFVPARVPAERLAAEALERLHSTVEECGATVSIGTLPWVEADPGKLAVIFQVLLDNALKFRRPGITPKVTVSGEQMTGGCLLRVRDNGIGIDPQFREDVFSLFSRLHTRDRIPGNGTGLALARKLVEAHRGRIWIEDGSEGGVAVCFTLPSGDDGNGGETGAAPGETPGETAG
jgi:PAS domain S-box-containing protein